MTAGDRHPGGGRDPDERNQKSKCMTRAAIFLLLLISCGSALAQSYPSRPVRIIVGFAAGGPSDIVARIVAQQLTDRLGRSVVVENRPGATGMIGAEVVAKAPP